MSKLKSPAPTILFIQTIRTLPGRSGKLPWSFADIRSASSFGARSLKILCAVGFATTTQSIWFLAPTQAQTSAGGQCATPGKDGVDSGAISIVNTYYAGPTSDTIVNAGATTLPVSAINTAGSQTTVTPGDLLLVIQMQDADINFSDTANYGAGTGTGSGSTNINRSGLYEYVVATNSVGSGGGSIAIRGTGTGGGLINSYRQEAAVINSHGQRSYQVIRVPQFISTTLTGTLRSPGSWNGKSGGIVAIDVLNTLTMAGGTIESRDKGFRGGGGTSNTDTYPLAEDEAFRTDGNIPRGGVKGEGIAGTPLYVFDGNSTINTGIDGYPRLPAADSYTTVVANNTNGGSRARGAPGNAGGGGNQHNSGGGGGGNAGVGGNGGNSIKLENRSDDNPTTGVSKPIGGRGGSAFPATPGRLIMGGGGGAGDANNGVAGSGGLGGGIVMIRAGTITGSGTISVSAFDGVVTPTDDGGSGAGAGGSILILAKSGSLASITLNASGGKGGDTNTAKPINYDFGPGGGGAGGSIFSSIPVGNTTVAGGLPGKSFNGQLGSPTTGVTRGATAGTIGQVTSITTSSSQVPGILAGSDCKAKVLLVKRITEIQGNRSQNPNDLSYRLDQVLDQPTFASDDPYPVNNWPGLFLVGAYDAGRIKPGQTIEYTIYFLNSSGTSAKNFRICDRIVGAQTFLKDAYGIGQDIQYKLGANPLRSLTRGIDIGTDRAQLDTTSTGAIPGCPASTITGTNNGTAIVDITGTGSSVQDNITEIPGATTPGTANSYGYFRFKTQVIP
jgi:uncharacterized repeat protein (TIGR01451 family)